MSIYEFPRAILGERGIAFNQRGMTIAGPVSLGGQSQVGSTDAGYWIATLDLTTIGQGTPVKVFRALRALLEGGAHQVLVPTSDEGQAPWPGAVQAPATVTWSDLTTWSDGSVWSQSTIAINVGTAAVARATSLDLDVLSAATLVGGEYLSIGDRLHVIRAIVSDDGAGNVVVAIWPPLREAVGAGVALNFDRPVCKMRQLADGETDLALGRLWQAAPTINFVEVF